MLTLLALVWVHFAADFLLQTDAMALRKSTSNAWLAFHVAVYSVCFLPFGWRFAAVTALAHFTTDWVSSRLTTRLWVAGARHWFFVVIGGDQAFHLTALILALEVR